MQNLCNFVIQSAEAQLLTENCKQELLEAGFKEFVPGEYKINSVEDQQKFDDIINKYYRGQEVVTYEHR